MLFLLKIFTGKRCKTPLDILWFREKAAGWHSQGSCFLPLTGGILSVKFIETNRMGVAKGWGRRKSGLMDMKFQFYKMKNF